MFDVYLSKQFTIFKKHIYTKKGIHQKEVSTLKIEKRGRPKHLFNEILQKPIQTIKALCFKGSPISFNEAGSITKGRRELL